jgi:hypothetical protein
VIADDSLGLVIKMHGSTSYLLTDQSVGSFRDCSASGSVSQIKYGGVRRIISIQYAEFGAYL